MYTDCPGFWETLGFDEEDDYVTFHNSRMKNSVVASDNRGFVNRDAVILEVRSRAMVTMTESLSDLYEVNAGEDGPWNRARLEFRFFTDVLPVVLGEKKPLDKNNVVEGLSAVIDDGLQLLSVDQSAISVDITGRYLHLRSKAFKKEGQPMPGAEAGKLTVVLDLNDKLTDFLDLDDQRLMFPLDDARTHQAEPRDDAVFDALEEHYPYMMLPEGHGVSNNYVEGRGFTSVLALVTAPGEFLGPGIIFTGDVDHLYVTYLGNRLKPVTLRQSMTFYVCIDMQRLF
jgi:hypothetical protein